MIESYRLLPSGGTSPLTILPDASGCLALKYTEGLLENIWLWGPMSKPRILLPNDDAGGGEVLLIEFYPLAMRKLIRLDLNEIADLILPLRVSEPALELYLKKNLQSLSRPFDLDQVLGQCISLSLNPQDVLSREVLQGEGKLYYSRRHIERVFKTCSGMSPKTLKRLRRFYRFIQIRKRAKESLEESAFKLGYYDASHLIRDFKSFAGVSPSEFSQNMSGFYSEARKLLP
ncbi:MAG: helix-turn-helix domain-containing protein [Anaerolineaceae bacterium]|nr:helix-turn-helix domain-containing protein [Anaerolineaceae bacterium]